MMVRVICLRSLFYWCLVSLTMLVTSSQEQAVQAPPELPPKKCRTTQQSSIYPAMILLECTTGTPTQNKCSSGISTSSFSTKVGEAKRIHILSNNVTSTLFHRNTAITGSFELWPLLELAPSATPASCNRQIRHKPLTRDPEIDTKIVTDISHRSVWQNFQNRLNPGCRDVLVVFTYNAVPAHPQAGALATDAIQQLMMGSMPLDILYLGYCFRSFNIPKYLRGRRFKKFHPKVTGLAPHCLHAYAVSSMGVAKLLNLTENCGVSLDDQIAVLANRGIINYKYVNATYDPEFQKSQFAHFGVHFGDDQQDGLFLGGALDVSFPPFVDGTAAHDLSRERSVLILVNGVWRMIPNADMFDQLLGRAEKGAVKVLTTWQMLQRYPEGQSLTESEVPLVLALRAKNIYPTIR